MGFPYSSTRFVVVFWTPEIPLSSPTIRLRISSYESPLMRAMMSWSPVVRSAEMTWVFL